MDSSLQAFQPLLIFIILALSLLSLLAFSFYHSKRIPYPPGPKGLPIIGNLSMVNQLDHRSLARLAKTYGGIVHLKMCRVDIVSIATPQMAREVLQAQDLIFSNRPATMSTRYLTYDRADMVFAHYSPFWRQMRKICVMKLFSRKQANAWSYVREEVGSLIQTLSHTIGSPVNVTKLLFKMSNNMTFKAAFGSTLLESQEFFVSIVKEFSLLFGETSMADFMPWLEWIVGKELKKRLVQARQSLDVFIDKVIDDHVAKERRISSRDENETDMVDELLAFYSEKEDNSVNSDYSQSFSKLTRDNIKGIIMDVMFGGTETIAIAAEWTMSELMKNPEELKRVQQELINQPNQSNGSDTNDK
ncbi:Cytochrome P450 [Dillenia turbinata]|uniref:Cytochrome P450 n=1 Tax=Dillenia turbinata TaxID=194707 RepID=A0AAN8YX03_9MAGN